jgi:hypothetical protein
MLAMVRFLRPSMRLRLQANKLHVLMQRNARWRRMGMWSPNRVQLGDVRDEACRQHDPTAGTSLWRKVFMNRTHESSSSGSAPCGKLIDVAFRHAVG